MSTPNSTKVEAPDQNKKEGFCGPSPTDVRVNDAVPLNPPGRGTADNRPAAAPKLLRCRKTLNFSTFNTRTLNSTQALNEIQFLAEKYEQEIICVQEHRFVHDEDIKFQHMDNTWLLITSSATRNSMGVAVGGVGFLLSPHASKCLQHVEKISYRILKASFSGNPANTIISCYSPTNASAKKKQMHSTRTSKVAINEILQGPQSSNQ